MAGSYTAATLATELQSTLAAVSIIPEDPFVVSGDPLANTLSISRPTQEAYAGFRFVTDHELKIKSFHLRFRASGV